jgi:nucleotide-binding universal stress UspA family protein
MQLVSNTSSTILNVPAAVSESILAQARASRASLIVVGSRGMGSIQR